MIFQINANVRYFSSVLQFGGNGTMTNDDISICFYKVAATEKSFLLQFSVMVVIRHYPIWMIQLLLECSSNWTMLSIYISVWFYNVLVT